MDNARSESEGAHMRRIPGFKKSRCVRNRWDHSSCTVCADVCRWDAISICENEVKIVEDRCVGCMCCVAACPPGAIRAEEFSLLHLIRSLAAHDAPVIGCGTVPHREVHVRLPCVGYLTGDVLLAIGLNVGKPLQINAINCEKCSAGSIIQQVKKDLLDIGKQMTDGLPFYVRVVDSEQKLEFKRSKLSRRQFFSQSLEELRSRFQRAIDTMETLGDGAYGAKTQPEGRVALNAAADALSSDAVDVLLAACYFDVYEAKSCDACGLCVGLCPSGALALKQKGDTGKRGLVFSTALCSGCGLCVEACPKEAILLRRNYSKTRRSGLNTYVEK